MTDTDARHETEGSPDPATAMLQYQEYYAIREQLDINVVPLPHSQVLPPEDAFSAHIPDVFRLASELQIVDAAALAQLRRFGDAAQVISDLLNQQNRKLNALLGYLLRREDQPEHRKTAFEYGGAGVGFYSANPYPLNELIELKLFMPAESAALYTIAEVIQCEAAEHDAEEGETYKVTALFRRITDDDRELMVKASLHAQSRLLKKRANERANQP